MPKSPRTHDEIEADLRVVEHALDHDWREPLQVIRLFTHLQQRTGHPTGDEILQAVETMSTRFNRMLAYLRCHPAPGATRFLSVWDTLDSEATFSGEDVRIGLSAEVLRDVLHELLENTVRHGAPPVTVDLRPTAEGFLLTVCDAGPGLPTGFDPFAPTTTRDPSRHAGMGLALVRRSMGLLGGTVYAIPTGTGTRIAVTIPAPSS